MTRETVSLNNQIGARGHSPAGRKQQNQLKQSNRGFTKARTNEKQGNNQSRPSKFLGTIFETDGAIYRFVTTPRDLSRRTNSRARHHAFVKVGVPIECEKNRESGRIARLRFTDLQSYDRLMCPWNEFKQSSPGFCEQALCAFIKEPANTWSNIGYLIVGIWIWKRARRDGVIGLRMLSVAAIATGIGSAVYHATYLRWAGMADYLGMFLGTGALTALNSKRLFAIKWNVAYLIFALVSASFLFSTLLFPNWSRWIFALGGPCCALEIVLHLRARRKTDYRLYTIAWIAVAIAVAFWSLDVSLILCRPDNHVLGGHALWHLFTASALYFIYRFYTQFDELRFDVAPRT